MNDLLVRGYLSLKILMLKSLMYLDETAYDYKTNCETRICEKTFLCKNERVSSNTLREKIHILSFLYNFYAL